MDKEKQKRFLDGIQKRSKRNIEFSVYKYIEKKFILVPKGYSEGQSNLANELVGLDINTVDYNEKIKHYTEFLSTIDHYWYLGKIDLCKEIMLNLT